MISAGIPSISSTIVWKELCGRKSSSVIDHQCLEELRRTIQPVDGNPSIVDPSTAAGAGGMRFHRKSLLVFGWTVPPTM